MLKEIHKTFSNKRSNSLTRMLPGQYKHNITSLSLLPIKPYRWYDIISDREAEMLDLDIPTYNKI